MSKDDNLILQIGDEERNSTTEKKEINDGKKELNDGKKELNDWKEELNDGKKELNDGKKGTQRRKKKFYEIKRMARPRDCKQNGNNNFRCATRRKNHEIRNPTRKRIHTTGI